MPEMQRVKLINGNGSKRQFNPKKNPYFIPLSEKAFCGPEVRKQMVYYLKNMIPPRDACYLIGLFESTHYRWMRNGREYLTSLEEEWDKKPLKASKMYAEYYIAINKASAICRQIIIERSLVPDKMVVSWVRDMTILERRDRESWARDREPMLDRQEDYDPDEKFL